MRIILLALAIGAAIAAPAHAAPMPDKVWRAFLDDTMSQYGEVDYNDMEDRLYAASQGTRTQAAAVAEFAADFKLDLATAQDYAAMIAEASIYFNHCDKQCPFGPGVKVHDDLARLAPGDPTGKLLATVGKHVEDDGAEALVRLAWNLPAAGPALLDIAGYNGNEVVMAAAMIRLPADPAGLDRPEFAPLELSTDWPDAPDSQNGYLPAVAEATLARLADVPGAGAEAWRARLIDYLMAHDLWLGRDREAVARYLAAPPELRAKLGEGELADRLAAALWSQGDKAEALAVVKTARGTATGPDMMSDVLTPSIPDAQLFDLYIEGPPSSDGEDQGSRDGWLSSLGYETPALRQVVAARLDAAGYHDMAAWLGRPAKHWHNRWQRANLPAIKDLIPADALALQPVWQKRFADYATTAEAAEADSGTIHVTTTRLDPWWSEKPLPAGTRPWREGDKPVKVPEDPAMPVPADAVLRYEASGNDAAIVYESSQYDRAGEVPAYGLWLALKRDGGWGKPVYLGLQSYFPYVATPASKLPLIAGERLQMEVQVREIDRDTITFPPVGLGYTREQDGLYLDMALADLMRDSDGDGLTDIEEARLGLKPGVADSDGDGLDDGKDPLPLTAYDPGVDPATAEIGRMILQEVVGADEGAIMIRPRDTGTAVSGDDLASLLAGMGGAAAATAPRNTVFLVSDTDLFSGIATTPFRLIVYSNGDLKRLGRGDIPFYPPEITRMFRSLDGSRTFVDWSAGWVGGSFMITCKDGACTSESRGSWIT